MASPRTRYDLIRLSTSPFCGGHREVVTGLSPDNERDQGLVRFTLLPSQKEVGCEEHKRDRALWRGWKCAMLGCGDVQPAVSLRSKERKPSREETAQTPSLAWASVQREQDHKQTALQGPWRLEGSNQHLITQLSSLVLGTPVC